VREERLLLDLRSVFPRQDLDLVSAVQALRAGSNSQSPPESADGSQNSRS
jgi:hypothetical protein